MLGHLTHDSVLWQMCMCINEGRLSCDTRDPSMHPSHHIRGIYEWPARCVLHGGHGSGSWPVTEGNLGNGEGRGWRGEKAILGEFRLERRE